MLTSSAHDTKRTCDFLATAGIDAQPCVDIDELLTAVQERCPPAALVAEETLAGHLPRLAAILAKQPLGSDVAVLLLVAPRRAALPDASCAEFMDALGNTVLLTRPVHPITLLSAVRAVLHAYQYRRGSVERAREADDLRRELERLARRDRRKDEFIAQLAHELRNPLAPIHNAVHVLRIQPDPPDASHVKWAIDVIGRQTQQLARLSDDLRDAARAAGGAVVLRKEPIELGQVLAQAIENVRALANARKLSVIYHPPVDFVRAEVDPARLQQIVGKLLQYAAHTTPAGGRILVASHRDDDTAVVTISDDGIGMSAETLADVFEPFQVIRPVDEVPAVVGLGLALAQRLAQLHGGSVEVRSEGPGKGSVYVLRLPALPRALADLAPPAEPVEGAARWRILVVDDEPDVAQSFSLLLSLMGHDVLAVNDAAAALRAVPKFQPEVAFVDIGLPEMDGFALAPLLRAAKPNDLRLVALTGYGHEEIVQRAAAAGFEHVLLKPVAAEEVERLLASYRPP